MVMETIRQFFRRLRGKPKKERVFTMLDQTPVPTPPTPLILTVLRPVPIQYPVSSPFGQRNINGEKEFHNGIDFATPQGTDVQAMVDGKIFRVGWQSPGFPDIGFGYRIWQESVIRDERFYIWYAHLSQIHVQEVDNVKAGEIIGKTGNTGRSTGPHLHVQMRRRDTKEYYDMMFENV